MLGTLQKRLEMMDMIEFENVLQDRIKEINFKIKNSNNSRESDFIINEIDVLESILGCLSGLKYGVDTRNRSRKFKL
jgi:hypothetical protein